MRIALILGAGALLFAGCAELDAAFEVLDVLTTPTDRQVCESALIEGHWLDGQCYTVKEDCTGRVVDGACYRGTLR